MDNGPSPEQIRDRILQYFNALEGTPISVTLHSDEFDKLIQADWSFSIGGGKGIPTNSEFFGDRYVTYKGRLVELRRRPADRPARSLVIGVRSKSGDVHYAESLEAFGRWRRLEEPSPPEDFETRFQRFLSE